VSVIGFSLRPAPRILALVGAVCALSALTAPPATAQPKTLTLIVGGAAGVTYDT
jgi:hypothetical protein